MSKSLRRGCAAAGRRRGAVLVSLAALDGNVAARFKAIVIINEWAETLTPLLETGATVSGSGFRY